MGPVAFFGLATGFESAIPFVVALLFVAIGSILAQKFETALVLVVPP